MQHRSETRLIAPGEAKQILSTDLFAGQRNISTHHVAFLREAHARGEFDGGCAIRFATHRGRRFLVDGQHRLRFISEQDAPVEMVVIHTECANETDVALLYSRIDRGRGRHMADALRALGVADRIGLTATDCSYVLACGPVFANGLVGRTMVGASYENKSAEFRLTMMEPFFPAAQKYIAAIADTRDGKLFRRREVLAVGIATFADHPAAGRAYEFWAGVAGDDGLRASDPRKQALEFMRRTKPTHSGLGYLAHGLAACWNAWSRGDELRVVKVHDPKAHLKLSGTRWNGKAP